jgi:Na+-translocating ferredoxin:NAD+ oxidoreductase RNF subunit RnfB
MGMDQDVYRRLASRLDAIPNGFPRTKSGVELRLLAKMFTAEEAALASEMRLRPEAPEVIAQRVGKDSAATRALLMTMTREGLIRSTGRGEEIKFGLLPFMVGIYEFQIGRLDAEEASMIEEYAETLAKEVMGVPPSLHLVIPAEKSIPFEVQVFPYEQASQLLERSKSFGVRKCICRLQRSLVGKPCSHNVENCLVFAPIEGAFKGNPDIRAITKEEALDILRESEEEGLIHSSSNVREGQMYICNCCTCCCAFMRGIVQFGVENSFAKSDFLAAVGTELCTGCESCLGRCQFGALTVADGVSHVNGKRCAGCGLCVVSCPSKALRLVRKPEEETRVPPKDLAEWTAERAKIRGVSLQNIL